MKQQFKMPDGTKADCLSDTHAIEVEKSGFWYDSLAQSLHYALWKKEIAEQPDPRQVPSGPLVRPPLSPIFSIALCQPFSASFIALSVASLASATSGATCCSIPLRTTAISASVRPLKKEGAPSTADATRGSDTCCWRKPTLLPFSGCEVTERAVAMMTALPPKADILSVEIDVR
jgi:hypothetical protein